MYVLVAQDLMFATYPGPYGEAGAIIYWVTYEALMVFIIMRMFVMVVVTTFAEVDSLNEDFELRRLYKRAWQQLDPLVSFVESQLLR